MTDEVDRLLDFANGLEPRFADLDQAADRNVPLALFDGVGAGAEDRDSLGPAKVAPRGAGALPSYPLIGQKVRWKALDQNGAVVGESGPTDLDLAAPAAVTGAWDKPVDGVVRLTLDVLTSTGFRSGGETAEYRPFKLGSAPFPPDPAQISSNPAVH